MIVEYIIGILQNAVSYFKHIYFTSIEKQVLTTYTNLSRFSKMQLTIQYKPFPKRQNLGQDQTESVWRGRIKYTNNGDFCL